MDGTIVKRSRRVAFYGVPGTGETYTFHRMTGFTDMSTSKNPKEYTRQYIDEDFERSDITGYSPSVSYGFDLYNGNAVHSDIAKIGDDELTGDAAVRPIIFVDLDASGANAVKRDFTVVPDSEGDGTDAYTYSGTLRANGDKIHGTAASADDWQTITFTEAGESEE